MFKVVMEEEKPREKIWRREKTANMPYIFLVYLPLEWKYPNECS